MSRFNKICELVSKLRVELCINGDKDIIPKSFYIKKGMYINFVYSGKTHTFYDEDIYDYEYSNTTIILHADDK